MRTNTKTRKVWGSIEKTRKHQTKEDVTEILFNKNGKRAQREVLRELHRSAREGV